ncbi:TetR/AcrR family transcriptional regulator [Tanticharoenia sakaeratensis]|uniref:HTH-type transcriptional regulator yjgJ n=1 Tax=Tanticharoenia sakaeratensis NBRC 103193 TaxID=1231623 RepID=A0A0D6MN82_9PROT|nr:TetR/AcrR family transcriptional regulator [Tanticharoenia sakaeratensis]GAN55157.1 HTH-type transcriptional regulator yjgJ [Tanticharoenia sakaeratensis NBRC 103193]GBQ24953.1 transcriptional regulator [Tanticharoenia sakaeratensis NBRC 103193]
MTDHLLSKGARGRPRQFDPDAALITGRALFHTHGYAALGIAAITEALGIRPASFYAAFGSKAAYFERIAEAYVAEVMPLETFFRDDRPIVDSIAELLGEAARRYTAFKDQAGCLILEALRAHRGDEGRCIALRIAQIRREKLQAFIARSAPAVALIATEVVTVTMAGMSAAARDGVSCAGLEQVAAVATVGLRSLIEGSA